MSKTLVIVESPGKINKIGMYLGPQYIVKASIGHVQDLDKSTLSIDVENNFKPLYIVTPEKTKVVRELKALAKDCKEVVLATDGDREGEAIAMSLADVLRLKNPKRIVFNEITKNAINKAISNPTTINMDMVNAQQTRRLLDRLVGYKISPVLWRSIISNDMAKSAGRVQSVVVRIIIDKEQDIKQAISSPYFKTTGEFTINGNNIKAVLHNTSVQGNPLYCFESDEMAKEFLGKINSKTEFKVIGVDTKQSVRKPSPPFITSSLQQEASTKLHFSVKRTMDVAQSLYEAGLITYMRSDCPNMSKEAIEEATQYIVKEWGKEYSDPKNYTSKNANSQDAHECIRPTHMNMKEPENLDGDKLRLYNLIWKRSIASQMSNALVDVMTVVIDTIQGKKSILTSAHFISTLENVVFPGYMIVYDNTKQSEDSDQPTVGKIDIKVKDKMELQSIRVTEEYTKPPLRYNEAALVRYLEKNGIGRPSTYASIISKVIDRGYVEITDVTGEKKSSIQIELNKSFKIKESTKDLYIGKEMKKLVPTKLGNTVNEFMINNFTPIMDIEFTANFESYLDKIAEGKANHITVLRTFYDMFNPIVEKLMLQAKEKKTEVGSSTDRLLGTNSDGMEIYCGKGKYGPYVKIMDSGSKKDKWRFAPLKDIDLDSVTLEDAITLLEYPKDLGSIGNANVSLCKGPYGLYIKCGGKNYSIKEEKQVSDITLEYAKELIESGDPYAIKTFKVSGKTINVKKGEYGPYLQVVSGSKKQNIPLPQKYKDDIENLTIDSILEIIANKNGTKKSYSTKK
jgi:DNA topoisomerase-1